MTDDRLERALSEAIEDLAGASAPDYLDDILARTSRTRQRPWWTFPRRYLSMSSTLKFAVAATVAFVAGLGVATIVVPDGGSGVGPPGAAAPSPSPAAEGPPEVWLFSGQWEAMTQIPSDAETDRERWPMVSSRGNLWSFRTVEMSDPRFDGDVVISQNNDEYVVPAVTLYHRTFRVDNADGAWVEQPSLALLFPGDSGSASTTVFTGEGAYEGLTAIVEVDWISSSSGLFDVRGIITDAGIPPLPAPAPAPSPEP